MVITYIYNPKKYPLKFPDKCWNHYWTKQINLDEIVKNNVRFLSLKESIVYFLSLCKIYSTLETKTLCDTNLFTLTQSDSGKQRSIHDILRFTYNYKKCSTIEFTQAMGELFYEKVVLEYCFTIVRNVVKLFSNINPFEKYFKLDTEITNESEKKILLPFWEELQSTSLYKLREYQKGNLTEEPNFPSFIKWKDLNKNNCIVQYNLKLKKKLKIKSKDRSEE